MTYIEKLADDLNQKSQNYEIGKLQDIRKKLKGIQRKPTNFIFHQNSISKDKTYAFHSGARNKDEIQFNIAEEKGKNDTSFIRHGIAFSLQLSRTLTSIDGLIPKIRRFNDYVRHHSGDFASYRMWHWNSHSGRSGDYYPSPIPSELVVEGMFIFLGKRVPQPEVDITAILSDFDRLLQVYEFVESEDVNVTSVRGYPPFEFTAGNSRKAASTTTTRYERILNVQLRHNDIQEKIFARLTREYGAESVGTEQPNGIGGRIDVVVKTKERLIYYEIKVGSCIRSCIREAIGQLLEYSYWPSTKIPSELIIVGEAPNTEEAKQYLSRIESLIGIKLSYLQILIPVHEPA